MLTAIFFVAGPSILHSKFGVGISPILTGSMVPFANAGDVFITTKSEASNLKVGDVISINNQKTNVFYAHRIIEITQIGNSLSITTKGDANTSPEADQFLVGPTKSVSKVVGTLKWIGKPLSYLTSPQGRQASFSMIVLANIFGLGFFIFRKKEILMSVPELLGHSPELLLALKRIEILERNQTFSKDFIERLGDKANDDRYSKSLEALEREDVLQASNLEKENNLKHLNQQRS